MRAMILAAGKGTRIQPITHTVPKPMIPLVRKPILASIIEHLRRYGIEQIIVTTSHLAPLIENYFRDGDSFGVQIAYSFEGHLVNNKVQADMLLGSAGGMKKIQDFSGFFDDTFLVLCGDALIDLDIFQVLEFHQANHSIATIALKEVPMSEVSKYGVVQVNDSGKIVKFQEKPAQHEAMSNLVNTGIYLFEPEIFNYIPSNTHYDIGSQLFPKLAKAQLPFYGISLPFQWLDIGSIPDYWYATREILQGKVKGYVLPGREVRPGVLTGINLRVDFNAVEIIPPVYIGSSTYIGAGAKIHGPTVIGAGCVIHSGAVIKECLIDDYTRINEIANLEQLIVLGSKCIDPLGQSIVDIQESDISWLIDDARKTSTLSEVHQLISELAKERIGLSSL
jgi:mannose-1-phosphate guanylyltransferase